MVTLATPDRKRRRAMAAAILQCDQAAIGLAINDDWLVGDDAGEQLLVLQHIVPTCDIPAVANKHEATSQVLLFLCTPFMRQKVANRPSTNYADMCDISAVSDTSGELWTC
ncbi:hypothetical protein D9M68_779080 [compost metagenome]